MYGVLVEEVLQQAGRYYQYGWSPGEKWVRPCCGSLWREGVEIGFGDCLRDVFCIVITILKYDFQV